MRVSFDSDPVDGIVPGALPNPEIISKMRLSNAVKMGGLQKLVSK